MEANTPFLLPRSWCERVSRGTECCLKMKFLLWSSINSKDTPFQNVVKKAESQQLPPCVQGAPCCCPRTRSAARSWVSGGRRIRAQQAGAGGRPPSAPADAASICTAGQEIPPFRVPGSSRYHLGGPFHLRKYVGAGRGGRSEFASGAAGSEHTAPWTGSHRTGHGRQLLNCVRPFFSGGGGWEGGRGEVEGRREGQSAGTCQDEKGLPLHTDGTETQPGLRTPCAGSSAGLGWRAADADRASAGRSPRRRPRTGRGEGRGGGGKHGSPSARRCPAPRAGRPWPRGPRGRRPRDAGRAARTPEPAEEAVRSARGGLRVWAPAEASGPAAGRGAGTSSEDRGARSRAATRRLRAGGRGSDGGLVRGFRPPAHGSTTCFASSPSCGQSSLHVAPPTPPPSPGTGGGGPEPRLRATPLFTAQPHAPPQPAVARSTGNWGSLSSSRGSVRRRGEATRRGRERRGLRRHLHTSGGGGDCP